LGVQQFLEERQVQSGELQSGGGGDGGGQQGIGQGAGPLPGIRSGSEPPDLSCGGKGHPGCWPGTLVHIVTLRGCLAFEMTNRPARGISRRVRPGCQELR
jgi:hypothetical protein